VPLKKSDKLVAAVEQLKQEMNGVTEEEWIQAVMNSRKRRLIEVKR
jgi:hypothetical protein